MTKRSKLPDSSLSPSIQKLYAEGERRDQITGIWIVILIIIFIGILPWVTDSRF